MSESYVVLGAGAAGLAAVRAIRRRDAAGRIIVLTAESCPAYSPALLPYLLAGTVEEKSLALADQRFYDAHQAVLVSGTRVVGVDFEGRTVLVEPGGAIEYTTLLIATGATTRGEEVPGANAADGPLTLRTLADARILQRRLEEAETVGVLGAGLAGLEIAMAARKLGKQVTVLARSDQILSRNAGADEAVIVQRWLEDAGIRFVLSRGTPAFEHAGGRRYLTTSQGDAVPADVLVAAKGAVPNTAWVPPAAAATDQGLAVDVGMRTGIPDVFAAGDAALTRHAVTGQVEAFATWPSACAQGAVAGANMAGGDAWLTGEIPFNVLPVFDRRVSFMGCTSPEALRCLGEGVEQTVIGGPASGRGRTLWLHGGRVVGAVVFGAQRDAGRLRQAIQSGVDVSSRYGGVQRPPRRMSLRR